MRTCSRCEKMSALCTFIETTDSFGASNLNCDAQPPVTSSSDPISDASHAPRVP
jgi:hypothetical protein